MQIRKNKAVCLVALSALLWGFSSCTKELDVSTGTGKPISSAAFNYESQSDYSIRILFKGVTGKPVVNTGVEIFDHNPRIAGTSEWKSDSKPFITSQTDATGLLTSSFTLSSIVDTIYIKLNSIDFPMPVKIAMTSGNVSLTVSLQSASIFKSITASSVPWKYEVTPFSTSSNLWILGDFTNTGYPTYIDSRDVVDEELKVAINQMLPEKTSLLTRYPDLFVDPNNEYFNLTEKCQLSISFLTEGAWWHNTMGYFYFPTNNVPASLSAIRRQIVIFPNSSTPYGTIPFDSGDGGMIQGDKVRLKYYDEKAGVWTDTFPAGISVGWFLYPDCYVCGVGANRGIFPTFDPLFSVSSLNVNKLQQNILLYDSVTESVIISFEDTERNEKGVLGDMDFNDVLYYATSVPSSAIDKSKMKRLIRLKLQDTDKDGVTDDIDEFPTDPLRAFTQYYPTTGVGTLAFEDNWPNKGDYDFNDLVVSYRYKLVTDASGNVKDVRASYSVEAVGAKYNNGFAIQLKTSPNNIESVTGQRGLDGSSSFNVSAKGYEKNQTYAVIPVFTDAHRLFGYYSTEFINTIQSMPTLPAVPIELAVTFVNAVSPASLGSAPFNPFLVVDQQRGREVHLAGQYPTDLANRTLFGTGDDRTNLSTILYKGDLEYPWALNIPSTFYYPVELARIDEVYLRLPAWVQSLGTIYTDWYSKPAFRNTTKVYQKH